MVGDTIIDSYTHCALIGGMTKTPTMSVRYDKRLDFVGGAGIVAKHLRSAGADVTFSTVLGNDALGRIRAQGLGRRRRQVHADHRPHRPTTHKNAIIAGGYQPAQDRHARQSLDLRAHCCTRIAQQVGDTPTDIVVFSDFRHGIFNRDTIPSLIDGDSARTRSASPTARSRAAGAIFSNSTVSI